MPKSSMASWQKHCHRPHININGSMNTCMDTSITNNNQLPGGAGYTVVVRRGKRRLPPARSSETRSSSPRGTLGYGDVKKEICFGALRLNYQRSMIGLEANDFSAIFGLPPFVSATPMYGIITIPTPTVGWTRA